MGVPNKKKPLISKSFRLAGNTCQKLDLFVKAGKDVNTWVRDLIDKGVEDVLGNDEELVLKIQDLENPPQA